MIATLDDMKSWLNIEGVFDTPEVILTCSYDCNIRCDCCFLNPVKPFMGKRMLQKWALEKVVKWAVEHNYPMYTGSGEPFFWWDYTRDILLPVVKEYGGKLMMSSNGKFGENPEILSQAVNAGIEYLSLSVDPWHKVSIEAVNNVIKAFKDTDTMVLISQITNPQFPIGTVRPVFYDLMVKIDWPMDHNGNESQVMYGHDWDGNILGLVK